MEMVTETSNSFLTHTDWAGYLKVREALSDGVHVTYSSGRLELMSPTRRHEKRKSVLGRLLEQFFLHRGLDFDCGGSTTMQSESLGKAMEPDECYWVGPSQPGEEDADSPPDLAIEVEVSQSLIPRLPILASMRVPEVWRYSSAGKLTIYRLEKADYQQVSASVLLPELPVRELEKHVELGRSETLSSALVSWLSFLKSQPL
jgi:Uma2 family endonuclease